MFSWVDVEGFVRRDQWCFIEIHAWMVVVRADRVAFGWILGAFAEEYSVMGDG
ncbi:hypothetical protein P8610_18335 [Fictibacillus sp. UD]|uniref:hypothetical protein n=1 Tax=Fictibacillus sp. UD TaxID=3038777 RepID=UPI003746603B